MTMITALIASSIHGATKRLEFESPLGSVSRNRPATGHANKAPIAPAASSASISLRFISLKASSQTNAASSTRTGKRASPQCAGSVNSQVIALHDFQGSEPFGLSIVAVGPPSCRAHRQDHWQAQRNREIEIELRADVRVMTAPALLTLCNHPSGEDRGAHVAQIESGGAHFGET